MLKIALCVAAIVLLGFLALATIYAAAWGIGPAVLIPLYLLAFFVAIVLGALVRLSRMNRHA
jgi:hypothetical protein